MFRKAVATLGAVLLTASVAEAVPQSGTDTTTAKQGSGHSTANKKKATKKHKKSSAKKHKKTTTSTPASGSSSPK